MMLELRLTTSAGCHNTLDVKVYATRDSVDIQGIIPANLLTTEQTSGCLIVNDYNSSTGKEAVSILPLQAVSP